MTLMAIRVSNEKLEELRGQAKCRGITLSALVRQRLGAELARDLRRADR